MAVLARFALVACLLFPVYSISANPPGNKSELYDAISLAKQRVWLIASSLKNGELGSALLLAKYRGVDTRVALSANVGKEPPLTRDLGLPLAHSRTVKTAFRCQILVDERIFVHDDCSEHSGPWRSLEMANGFSQVAMTFKQQFGTTGKVAVAAVAPTAKSAPEAQEQEGEWKFSPFVYNAKRSARPEGVTRTLPRTLRYLEKSSLP